MRELEFLPEWYPHARRRRRIVLLQGWLTVLLILGMGAYLGLADRNIRIAEQSVGALSGQLSQTASQLFEMDKLESRMRQLRQQDQIIQRLGLHVEAGTVVQTLDGILPRQMALLGLQLDNEERVEVSAVQAAKLGGDAPVDRRLRVKMQGVCPTDVDLANFMTQLSSIAFFENVNITYAREKGEQGHVMREFEVTFSLNLNTAAAGVAGAAAAGQVQ